MTADDDFLSRWSRRKRAATEVERSSFAKTEESKPTNSAVAPQNTEARNQKTEAAFDVTKLPPVDSITALSDIRDFLRAGVPPDLTRAALRRAWSADPAIRDFIGLAENAWDFTDPTAMPGFGPLEATDDVRQMVEQIMSRVGEEAKSLGNAISENGEPSDFQQVLAPPPHDKSSIKQDVISNRADQPAVGATSSSAEDDHEVSAATQHDDAATTIEPAQEQKILRRTHGSALPH